MLRTSLVPVLTMFALTFVPPSDAQRRQAEIVQGVTSGELAGTVEELRLSNAQLRARMTGIESDKARLNGKLETLEFLLSESRDEINRMQSDDAELQRLITRLEARLSEQEDTITSLQSELQAIRPEPAFLSNTGPASQSTFSQSVERDSLDSGVTSLDDAETGVSIASVSGPTRIVRREDPSIADSGDSVQLGPDGNPLPQGSLGTLPASALPGQAGPLFAEAKSRLLQFDYAGAEVAFRSFLSAFQDDPQAGEAQYWLAEVLYQQEMYPESGAAYTDMIRTYPDDPRAPEALAKLARSMRLVGDTAQACNALDLLPQRYPNASGVTKNLAAGERVRSGCDS